MDKKRPREFVKNVHENSSSENVHKNSLSTRILHPIAAGVMDWGRVADNLKILNEVCIYQYVNVLLGI